MTGSHGPVIAVGPTSLLSALLRLKPKRSISETITGKKKKKKICCCYTENLTIPFHPSTVLYARCLAPTCKCSGLQVLRYAAGAAQLMDSGKCQMFWLDPH